MILARWDEFLQNLLNKVHATEPDFLDDLPILLISPNLDDPPSFNKVEKAALSLKDNTAAGPDNIPAEVISMVGVLYIRGSIIFFLTAGPPSVSHSI